MNLFEPVATSKTPSPSPARNPQRNLLPNLIDELVVVVLEAEGRVEDAQAAEDPEEVVVAAEEHVKPHLDVVAIFVLPASHLGVVVMEVEVEAVCARPREREERGSFMLRNALCTHAA